MVGQDEQPGWNQAACSSNCLCPAAACSRTAQRWDVWRGERRGALSLVRFHDGVPCALRALQKEMSVFDLTRLSGGQDPAPLQAGMCY